MAERDLVADAEELKAKGNKFLADKEFDQAISYYSEAIKLNPNSHVYFSNRSAAYLSKDYADSALKDAETCIGMKPDWAKGYSRKGAALHKLKKYDESAAAYEAGLVVDPNNAALKSGLEEVKQAQAAPPSYSGGGGGAGGAGGNPLGQLFGPDMFEKIRANPKIAHHMDDPTYVQMMELLQKNPQMMSSFMQDPRMLETMGALMGVDMSTMGGGAGAGGASPDAGAGAAAAAAPAETGQERSDRERKERWAAEKKKKEAAAKKLEEERQAELAKMSEEERQALDCKARGNEHYKKREFEEALKAYDEAIALNGKDMSFYTNKAAVILEQGDLEGCISECKKALEVGKENRASYEQQAKAWARMGNACYKNKLWERAVEYYQSAQLEFKSNDVARKMKKAEIALKKTAAEAYLDPEKAAEAKERGNVAFKAGDFPLAVEEYSDAIKRDPSNAVYYANRAAAYTKMMDMGRATDDCNKSLELDPTYIKAYARKGNLEFFRKEYHKALDTYRKGLEIDPDNKECRDGLYKTNMAVRTEQSTGGSEVRAQRAMEDPEIRAIMNDPVMRTVLEDMGKDPAAAQKHMANPGIAAKIEKLIAAGIVRTG